MRLTLTTLSLTGSLTGSLPAFVSRPVLLVITALCLLALRGGSFDLVGKRLLLLLLLLLLLCGALSRAVRCCRGLAGLG